MAKKDRKVPRRVAFVLIIILLLGALSLVLVSAFRPDLLPEQYASLPRQVVTTAIKPFQTAFTWVVSGVTEYLQSWKLRTTLELEYNKLKAQNDELVYQALLNSELEAKVERLERLLDESYKKTSMNPILANVIAKETGNWFQMFTIDKGEKHGVKDYMAVINEDGLIGYIYHVDKTTSDVVTIVDSRSSISAIIASSRDQGTVRGTLGIEDEATCRMYYLPVDLVPRPGDVVQTAGVGLPFPKGLAIGVVRESTRYMDENKHYVVIEPYVDFMHIEEVLVLIYDAPAEDMPDADDGQLKYEPVPLDTMRPDPVLGEEISDPNLGAVTPPPRAPREGGLEEYPDDAPTDAFTLAPGATPTPNPELDALLREELEREALEGGGD